MTLCGAADASELRWTPIVKAVEQARPSIVNIHGEKTLAGDARGVGEEERRVNGMGTGVIIDQRGYIITNHHVVDGVSKIKVTLADGQTHIAKLISHDRATDLAVIKIDVDEELPIINIGTSSDLMPGESVVAVGNAYGYEHTVTWGIISALHRSVQVSDAQQYEDLIQTDASINPGNSGGPLLNIDGQMIGVNVAVRAGAQGIGFAIPVDKVMEVAAELMSAQRVGAISHGITAQKAKEAGLVIETVAKSSPAAEIGLKPGDIIISADGQLLERPLDLERALVEKKAGDSAPLVVKRGDESMKLSLVLGAANKAATPEYDPTWELLGLRLEAVPPKQFARYRTRFKGGLEVVEVRPGGPAAKHGIRRGDILVGMHVWETVSLDNVAYILERRDFASLNPLKFYIVRGNETLYGALTVAHRDTR